MAANPRKVDWIIIGVYLLGQFSLLVFAGTLAVTYEGARAGDIFGFGWEIASLPLRLAVICFALYNRRRMPVFCALVCAIVCFLGTTQDSENLLAAADFVAILVQIYSAAAEHGTKQGWIAVLAAGVTVWFAAGVMWGQGPMGAYIAMGVLTGSSFLSAQFYGMFVGGRRRYVEALIAYAGQLAHEREQRAQLAASQERERIAREMHDIVAHSLSVVVTLSEGAQAALAVQPAAARAAMQQAASTGREALTQMRGLLGVLAPQEGKERPRAPMPQLTDIPELVQSFERAGLRVQCEGLLQEILAGTEVTVPKLDQTRQLTLYRVLQEALTNSLRYAGPGAQVRASLTTTAAVTTLTVHDSGQVVQTSGNGDVPYPRKQIPGAGRGLSGARARVAVFGGVLVAAPAAEGGWEVCATIPHGEDEGQTVAPQEER